MNNNSIKNKFNNFIYDSIHMFSSMDRINIIKCILNLFITFLVLSILSTIIYLILHSFIFYFLKIIPYSNITDSINSVISIIYLIFSIITNLFIIYDLFKTNYLNRYRYFIKNNTIEIKYDNYSLNKVIKEYISLVILFFTIFISIVFFIFIVCFISIFIFSSLTLLLNSKYIYFIILFITLIFIINLILIIIHFVFKKVFNEKKIIILSSFTSILFVIIGSGVMLVSSLNYNFINDSFKEVNTNTFIFTMNSDLVIMNQSDVNIKYIEDNIDDVKVVVELVKNNDSYKISYDMIDSAVAFKYEYKNNINIFKFIVDKLNKKLVDIDNKIKSITIYTNDKNIDILKNNYINFFNNNDTQ